MNAALLNCLLDQALQRQITFPEILAALAQEGIESCHVDFLRNECRYYHRNGESFVAQVGFSHDGVAAEFSAARLQAINRRVQAGEAGYDDFVREGAGAGCAYYIVYLQGKMVRYFGREGGEHVQYFSGGRPGGQKSGETGWARISRSAIKYADIQAAPDEVYEFLSDPTNWPRYAVVNLRAVSPGPDGWFKATTKFGEGEIRVDGVKESGILDHVWKDPQASWKVYSRVVPNGAGSTVMLTLFQPRVMNDAQFDQAMQDMDIEMATLKEILER